MLASYSCAHSSCGSWCTATGDMSHLTLLDSMASLRVGSWQRLGSTHHMNATSPSINEGIMVVSESLQLQHTP